jgi:hypothetical protein
MVSNLDIQRALLDMGDVSQHEVNLKKLMIHMLDDIATVDTRTAQFNRLYASNNSSIHTNICSKTRESQGAFGRYKTSSGQSDATC